MKQVTRQAGFTLVEVMVALLLTAIAVMGIIGLFLAETRASSFSRHNAEAAVLANDKAETLRTTKSASIASGNDATSLDAEGNAGGIFYRKWTWTQGTDTTYSAVTVMVGWDEDSTTTTSCSTDTTCNGVTTGATGFCEPVAGVCADRVVIVRGKRIN